MPPIMQDDKLNHYLGAVRTACAKALDAGVRYQDEFAKFVREIVDHLDPAENNFLENLRLGNPLAADTKRLELAALVAASPRGTWATCKFESWEHKPYWFTFISDGAGKCAPGGSFDSYPSPPSYAKIYGRMVEQEIYRVRREVEHDRKIEANRTTLDSLGLSNETVFKNIKLNNRRYSTAVVTKIDPDTSIISLRLTRRGSPYRVATTISATDLATALGTPKAIL